MGMVFCFECKDCSYKNAFFEGAGFLTAVTGKISELYFCPNCDNLCVRETSVDTSEDDSISASAAEEVQVCEKCSSIMYPVKDHRKLKCPNCHGKNYEYYPEGFWD